MNTSLVISGYALYLFFCFVAILIIGFIFFGCAYVKEARDKEKADKRYRKLCQSYNRLLGMYQKDTFTVPDVEETGNV